MGDAIKESDAFVVLQTRMQSVHIAFHDKHAELLKTRNLERQKIAEKRQQVMNSWYQKQCEAFKANPTGKPPLHPWAQVLLAHSDLTRELFGPYDKKTLAALTNLNVTCQEDGTQRLVLTFDGSQNEFFEQVELWAEMNLEGEMKFSGVTWKKGKGPFGDDEEEQKTAFEQVPLGQKRPRGELEAAAQEANAAGSTSESTSGSLIDRGPSFFDFFSLLGSNDQDDDSEADMTSEAEDQLAERREVWQALVEEVWIDPAAVLRTGSVPSSGGAPA